MQVSPHLKYVKKKIPRIPLLLNSELIRNQSRVQQEPQQQPPPPDAATSLKVINYDDNEGILIYFWNALDFQRPKALICASDIPASAAKEAAPIRKL